MHPIVALSLSLVVFPVVMNAYSLPLEGFTKYCRGSREATGPRRWDGLLFLAHPTIALRGVHLILHYSFMGALVALWAIRRGNLGGLFSLSTDDFPAPVAEILSSWRYDCVAAAIVTVEILVAWGLVGVICYACSRVPA
jgi:hypothetical protein